LQADPFSNAGRNFATIAQFDKEKWTDRRGEENRKGMKE
jgi:hypothetical protein